MPHFLREDVRERAVSAARKHHLSSVSVELLATQRQSQSVTAELVARHLVQRVELDQRRRKQRPSVVGELGEQFTLFVSLPGPRVWLLTLELVEGGAEGVTDGVGELGVAAALVLANC